MSYHENNPQFTIGGVTYNEDMVPIGFSEDYATGFNDQIDRPPLNALAASVTASNGTDYGIYTTVNGINTEIKTLDENATVVANRNDDGTWNIQDDYQDVFSNDDATNAENNLQEAVNGNANFWNSYGASDTVADNTGEGLENNNNTNNASLTNDDGGAGDVAKLRENYSVGRVDHIIQKLSLRNLVYPIDADFGNTQDYIQINQFTYKPINQDVFFGGLTGNAGSTLLNGLQNTSPKEKYLGLVKLPMPNQLQDSNNVAWGQDQLNAITAAVAGAVFGVSGKGLDLMGELITGERKLFGKPEDNQKLSLMGEARKILSKDGRDSAGAKIGSFIDKLKNNSDAQLLGRSVLGSAILNVAQFGVSPETALARGAGVVPNSNMQLLFNAPTLREFTFNWRLTARSREEAIRVKNIIRFFKQGMAVKKNNKNKTGEGSFFLGTPNIFDIHFKTSKQNYEILDRNDSVLRIKTCALTGVAVNYTPDGMWNAYEKGMPTSVLLSLRFGELEPIFDTDYEEDPFKINNKVTDQRSVPIDAIGY